MAVPDRQQKPDIARSEQGVQNWSFDEVYKVLATIPVGEYNNALYRLQVDSTGALKTTGGGSSSTEPVDLVAQDLFGSAVSGSRYNQVEIDFSATDPDAVSGLTVTKTVSGDASNSGGQAVFTSGTNTNGGVKAVTTTEVTYRPHAESFAAFTAIFTTGIASSYQRIGLYDDNNGFFIGYEGTSFGVTKRSGAVDVTTAKASFSEDTLSGQTGSGYTRNGTPEAIDFTKDNLFRIRFGWLGAAPIYFEVFSPDGEWVVFHKIKHPNTVAVPTIQDPNLPITLDIKKTSAGATALVMSTACWAAGTTSNFLKMVDTITDNTLAGLTRSVIAGRASSGGGTYYNVKVNPSGSLETNATVQGDVAAAGTDSGNPVKIGGVFNSTQPTYTNGQRTNAEFDSRGNQRVSLNVPNSATVISSFADNADSVATVTTANKLAVQNRNTVYNGTSWDRMRGDTTTGTWVNVKNTLVQVNYDYVAVTYPTTSSEVYTYKTGGSGGTTVATVTVTYIDSTKENISSVART